MIVLQPPLVRHFLEQHQVFQREIVCIIDNQTLGAVLVQVSHEFGLTGAPMPSDREAKRRKKLVAQCLLIVIVFGSHYRENGSSASRFEQVANAHGFARARISHDHMPGTIVPGGMQHLLKTFREGRFDEHVLSEEWMGHARSSSRIMRTGKTGTGRSGSASGRGSASVTTCVIWACTSANRSETRAVCMSGRWRS